MIIYYEGQVIRFKRYCYIILRNFRQEEIFIMCKKQQDFTVGIHRLIMLMYFTSTCGNVPKLLFTYLVIQNDNPQKFEKKSIE